MKSIARRSTIAMFMSLLMMGFAASAGPSLVFGALVGDPLDSTLISDALAEKAASPETHDLMKRYIIVLDDPPLAYYRGGNRGLAPPAVDTAGGKIVDGEETVHLAIDTPAAKAYVGYLKGQQARMIEKIQYIAPKFTGGQHWNYTNILNGFSGHLKPAEAMRVLRIPGVRLSSRRALRGDGFNPAPYRRL